MLTDKSPSHIFCLRFWKESIFPCQSFHHSTLIQNKHQKKKKRKTERYRKLSRGTQQSCLSHLEDCPKRFLQKKKKKKILRRTQFSSQLKFIKEHPAEKTHPANTASAGLSETKQNMRRKHPSLSVRPHNQRLIHRNDLQYDKSKWICCGRLRGARRKCNYITSHGPLPQTNWLWARRETDMPRRNTGSADNPRGR